MKYRPSAVESFIATLPEDLQKEALEAVAEEYWRVKNGPWTEDEIRMRQVVSDFASSARKKREGIAASCFA